MKKYLVYLSIAMAFIALAFTQTIKITGKVINEKGKPLAGVSVIIKGASKGTTTAADGTFSIEVPGEKTVLIIAFVGYNQKEIKVGKQTTLVIQLERANEQLSEVVVIGYGTALQGSVAGVQLRQGKADMKIRGFANNNTPAYDSEIKKERWRYNSDFNREGYDHINENSFLKTTDNPLSTFSIDVDAASYSNVRRMINNGSLPPAGAVRIEEMINYFTYDYPQPNNNDPFSVNTEIATCPWNADHRLVSIGLQGKKISAENLPPSNLTFLIDVSGSMNEWNKLPLVKLSLKLLTDQLREQDKVSIVVYAGNAGVVLSPTPGSDKMKKKQLLTILKQVVQLPVDKELNLLIKQQKKIFFQREITG